jgi:hypothetical protein
MAGRKTNLALAALLAVAAVSGIVSYGIGTGWARPILAVHSIAAFAIVLLVPWKSSIMQRGLRRGRGGGPLSIALAVLVVVTILSGVAHSVFNVESVGVVTIMQIHVTAALLAIALGVAHIRRRPQRVRVSDLSRRTFLRTTLLAAAAALGFVVIESAAGAVGLPGGHRRFTGSHEKGSFDPVGMPVTSWINDRQPSSYAREITVTIGDTDTSLTIEQLAAFDDRMVATLDCTGGWYATQEWSGARLSRVVSAPGSSIRVISATGYERRFPLEAAEHLLLATHAAGDTLSIGHGAPVRLVAPGRRGFWWVKWVEKIVVDDRPTWWQPPFPLT